MGRSAESGLAMVVVSGPGSVERAVFGLASALAAAASGIDVQIFLTDEGVHWAFADSRRSADSEEVADFPTIEELFGELHLRGIAIDACAERAEQLGAAGAGYLQRRVGVRLLPREIINHRVGMLRSVVC